MVFGDSAPAQIRLANFSKSLLDSPRYERNALRIWFFFVAMSTTRSKIIAAGSPDAVNIGLKDPIRASYVLLSLFEMSVQLSSAIAGVVASEHKTNAIILIIP